jgi:peptidoglycan/xylan/chitin deacetylase (PgdA/CDA1 family)
VPSFQQFRATEALWREFPGRERLDDARVALTFDDGPDPDATPAVLDALEAEGVTATFFIVGEQAAAHSRIAREVADRGHEIGLHGYGHREHSELSQREARDDLARGVGALEVTTGRRPRLFRPPYGRFSADSFAACGHLGLEPVLWSAWGMDWEPLPAERIVDLVSRDLESGAIVLLHDSARYASRGDARATAEAVPLLCAAARERGLAFGPVSEG